MDELVYAAQLWVRHAEVHLAPVGLTYSQYRVLRECPGTQIEISERIGTTPANMTGIVDRLEKGGWVVRARTADDRRTRRVERLRPLDDAEKAVDEAIRTMPAAVRSSIVAVYATLP